MSTIVRSQIYGHQRIRDHVPRYEVEIEITPGLILMSDVTASHSVGGLMGRLACAEHLTS